MQQFECTVDVSISSDGACSEISEQADIEAADEDQDGDGARPKIQPYTTNDAVIEDVTDVPKPDVRIFELSKPAIFKLLAKPANMSVLRCLRNVLPRHRLHHKSMKTQGPSFHQEAYIEMPVTGSDLNTAVIIESVDVATVDAGEQEDEGDDNEGSGAKGPICVYNSLRCYEHTNYHG